MLRRIHLASILLALPLLFACMVGCSAQVGYRTYDPYYHDYHVWSDAEGPYYNAWIVEANHPHVDYGPRAARTASSAGAGGTTTTTAADGALQPYSASINKK